jgi:hypothetical protein
MGLLFRTPDTAVISDEERPTTAVDRIRPAVEADRAVVVDRRASATSSADRISVGGQRPDNMCRDTKPGMNARRRRVSARRRSCQPFRSRSDIFFRRWGSRTTNPGTILRMRPLLQLTAVNVGKQRWPSKDNPATISTEQMGHHHEGTGPGPERSSPTRHASADADQAERRGRHPRQDYDKSACHPLVSRRWR